jgi:hypothetical protein
VGTVLVSFLKSLNAFPEAYFPETGFTMISGVASNGGTREPSSSGGAFSPRLFLKPNLWLDILHDDPMGDLE